MKPPSLNRSHMWPPVLSSLILSAVNDPAGFELRAFELSGRFELHHKTHSKSAPQLSGYSPPKALQRGWVVFGHAINISLHFGLDRQAVHLAPLSLQQQVEFDAELIHIPLYVV